MARLMSVAYTEDAVRARRKTVTRRLGWRHARAGDELELCRKVMGRKPGEPLERIVRVRVVEVRREPLSRMIDDPTYGWTEATREGFPTLAGDEFVHRLFVDAQKMAVSTDVARIEWRYLEHEPRYSLVGPCVCGHSQWRHRYGHGACVAGQGPCGCERWESSTVCIGEDG